jgi:hypothetical protein
MKIKVFQIRLNKEHFQTDQDFYKYSVLKFIQQSN